MINKFAISGASITISFIFNSDLVLTNTCDMKVYLGGILIGSLRSQIPPIVVSGIYYDLKLSGSKTILDSGYKEIVVILDDDGGIGVKKAIVGGITFQRFPDGFTSNSTSNIRDLIIELKHSDFFE